MAQFGSSSAAASPASPSCGAIQALRWHRPTGSAAPAAMFVNGGVAAARSPAGSLRCSRKTVGKSRSTLLPTRDADVRALFEGGTALKQGKRAAAAANMGVRASTTIGRVKEVGTEVEGLYYNVRLGVPLESEVARWYQTPGQFMDLLPVSSAHDDPRSFFIASPPNHWRVRGAQLFLDFLIEDVPGTVASELINSQHGDSVLVSTNSFSRGFNLQPVEAAEHVLMFASGYGLGSIRALIESKLIQAPQKKTAILYTMYAPGQEPYMDRHADWELLGVRVEPFQNSVDLIDPAKTVVLMNASEDEQMRLTECFVEKGVPDDQILVLWNGIPTKTTQAYINKINKLYGGPNCLHMGEQHIPFALKI